MKHNTYWESYRRQMRLLKRLWWLQLWLLKFLLVIAKLAYVTWG